MKQAEHFRLRVRYGPNRSWRIKLPPFASVLCCTFVCLCSVGASADDLSSKIRNASHEHPRLFFKRGEKTALREKIDSDAKFRKAYAHVISIADGILELKPVERKQIGRRLLGVSRTCLKRVTYLAFAHRLTKDPRYLEKAQQEMLAAAAFRDWNPSHFLDVGEMTAALAIGYDWLHEDLTPEARLAIKQAIIEKGLKTSLAGGWWVKAENNWNQVCHGGLTLGALSVLEDEPELATKIIERGLLNLPRAMAEYAPDGAYPEGPTYWKYGTTYNVILISALESVLGTDFGLSKSKGFLESSDYYVQVTGPTGLFFNYSDSSLTAGVSPAMYWFSAKRNKPSIMWQERQELARFLAETHRPDSSSNRFFPFLLIWGQPLASSSAPEVTHWHAGGRSPIGVHRSGWATPQETFAGVKAGSPSVNHAHMDIGSFVMDADGVRWAHDLVKQSYHDLESKGFSLFGKKQNSQRWQVFRLNNFSHNTLVVDGKQQIVPGHAPIVGFSDSGPMPHTIVDLLPAYQDQLASAKRGVGLRQDRSVLIQDEIESLDHKTTIRWGMVTRADVTIKGNRAILKEDDQQLSLRILSPAVARLELFETETPPAKHDAPNPGTKMIGFKIVLPASTKAKLVVLLQPGKATKKDPVVRPLSSW